MSDNCGGLRRGRSLILLGRVALSVALVMAAAAEPGQGQLRYSGTLAYSQGSYFFDEATGSFFLSNRLSARWERLDLSASLPFILQQEGTVTWAAGTPIPTGGSQHGVVAGRTSGSTVGARRGRRDGTVSDSVLVVDSDYSASVGDPLFGLGVEVYSGFGLVRSFRLDGRVKAPVTELGEGSGTGEWDYAGGASLTAAMGPALVFLDGTYWWIGDLPELELLNSLSYGLGVAVPWPDRHVSFLVGVSGSSKTVPSADVPLSVDGSVGVGVGDEGFFSAGLSLGLTESSPDFTIQAGYSLGISGLGRR